MKSIFSDYFIDHLPKLAYLTKVIQDVTVSQCYREAATEYWTAQVTLKLECVKNNPTIISSSNIVKDAMLHLSYEKQQQIYAAHIINLSLANLVSNILPIIQQCYKVIDKLRKLEEIKYDMNQKDVVFVLKQANEFIQQLESITQSPKNASIIFIVNQCQQFALANISKPTKYSTVQLECLIQESEKMMKL